MSFFVSFWVNLDSVVRYILVLQMLGAPKSGHTSHTTHISKPVCMGSYGNGGCFLLGVPGALLKLSPYRKRTFWWNGGCLIFAGS